MTEHPVEQPIRSIAVFGYEHDEENYTVGSGAVTRIEFFTKSGLHADIPYVRVWSGDVAIAEFCQHNIRGVYFNPPTPEPK